MLMDVFARNATLKCNVFKYGEMLGDSITALSSH